MSTIQEDKTLEYIRRIAEALEGIVTHLKPTVVFDDQKKPEYTPALTCTVCGKFIGRTGNPKETSRLVPLSSLISSKCCECNPKIWEYTKRKGRP